MRKCITLLALLGWVVVTSSNQNNHATRIEPSRTEVAIDSLNISLKKLNKVLDERD